MTSVDSNLALPSTTQPSWRAHVQIARPDHWIKNVFVLPGTVVALSLYPSRLTAGLALRIPVALLAVSLVASSNYVLNELLDARSDRHHPTKRNRPVPSGLVNVPLAYVEWLVLMAAGIALAFAFPAPFRISLVALWIMGCVYNVPPVRTKDLPYGDVLSEGLNNAIRMLAGWYLIGVNALPPTSLCVSYWMIGCYFMAIKRFAEYREIGRASREAYRLSFAFYTEQRLLVSIVFYAATAMLFLGAFTVRYRLELVLIFPAVALVLAIYFSLAFKPDSAAQRPESLHREPALMLASLMCVALMIALLFVDVPILHTIFEPTPGE